VDNGLVVDADGAQLRTVEPGGQFWLQPYLRAAAATVTATMTGLGGRVVTGVAANEADSALTPVALIEPVPTVVEFHLQWRNGVRVIS
jgi:hypothetical protein